MINFCFASSYQKGSGLCPWALRRCLTTSRATKQWSIIMALSWQQRMLPSTFSKTLPPNLWSSLMSSWQPRATRTAQPLLRTWSSSGYFCRLIRQWSSPQLFRLDERIWGCLTCSASKLGGWRAADLTRHGQSWLRRHLGQGNLQLDSNLPWCCGLGNQATTVHPISATRKWCKSRFRCAFQLWRDSVWSVNM